VDNKAIAEVMLQAGFFAHDGDTVPEAAWRWIDTFLEAYEGQIHAPQEALPLIVALRAESIVVPALALERLRSRQVLFFLDTVGQYVDDQPELRGLDLHHDLLVIAQEFGLAPEDALWAVRMALTGEASGPALGLFFPLLGHDRILMRIGAISSHLLHGRGLEPIRYGPGGEPFAPIQGRPPDSDGENVWHVV
jgi:Anticodon binding domain